MESFGNASHDDVQKLMDKSKNKNTTKTTEFMNVYHTCSKHRGELLEEEKVEPKKLEQFLHFHAELEKQDG